MKFLRSLDWRVLLSLPVIAALLGIANNLRVSPDLRVHWSGELPETASDKESYGEDTGFVGTGNAPFVGNGNAPEEASVAEAPVERGTWTTNFAVATNAAESAHLPVVVVAFQPGCPSCARFHSAIDNDEVRAWQKKLGWYFVMATSSKDKDTTDFVKSTPVRSKTPPYVGVYWLRPDGRRTMRNFSAKSGMMGVPEEGSTVQEWMHAVEASVPGAPGATFVSEKGLGVQVGAKIESQHFGLGRVKMSPETDLIMPGQKVEITAKPGKESEFAGWRFPDGRIVDGEPQLTLDDQCQAGVYRAIFRRVKKSNKSETPKADGEDK